MLMILLINFINV